MALAKVKRPYILLTGTAMVVGLPWITNAILRQRRPGRRGSELPEPFPVETTSHSLTFQTQFAPTVGMPVTINCPACGVQEVSAIPRERVDWAKFGGIIPLLKLRSTQVERGQCHARITCTLPLDRIAGANAATLSQFLRYHPGPAAKAASIAGLLTCLIPVLGMVLAAIATYLARGTQGWPAKVNLLSLIISIVVTFCILFIVFSPR